MSFKKGLFVVVIFNCKNVSGSLTLKLLFYLSVQ